MSFVNGVCVPTCFSHKHLLWGAGWPLAHSVVHTHAYLIALVFTELCRGK